MTPIQRAAAAIERMLSGDADGLVKYSPKRESTFRQPNPHTP